ncbi:hypothetical protein DYB30_009096 [Aphanomyces astaci]|uniref:Uncharacterized protein n=1 Tax=Aphanomyces astaci TaxID=112090 RepID=A0A397CRH4_APHAT|nr:hypothetical protein DYB30_009096 [Aphanomyces astaci]
MAKLSKSPPQLVTTQRTSPDKPWFRRCILACLTLQVLWTLAIPIKNVLIIPYPQFRSDDLSTSKQPYEGYDPDGNLTFSGDQVHALLLDVLAISFRNAQVRAIFQQKEDFAIDKLGQVLSPIDHKTMAQYYTLVFQSSEFPGGVFTEREDRVVSAQADGTKQVYTIGCRGDQTLMGGTTCIDANGLPCDDSAWGDTQTRTLKDVDFTPLLNGTGWQNNIGLLGLVEYFHYYMRLVFAKQNWAAVVASKNLDMGYIQVDDEGNVVEVPVIFNLATQSSRAIALNSSKIWNCLATEALLGEAYLANYTLGLIQSVLIEQNLYNATTLVTKSQIVTERALVVLRGSIRITSGAGYAGSRDTIKLLGNTIMTHTSVSSINLKRDRPMTGSQLMGSSMRNIMYMGYYPNSYYSVLKIFPNGSDFVFQSRALGGMFSGYNGFKFDFVHNTTTNFKLAERSVAAGSGYAYDWFAQERDIAAWYSKYESHRGNNLIDKAAFRFGSLDPSMETACFQALFKRIAQASWLLLLQWHPVTEHLAFMSVIDQSPQLYFLKQMLKNEMVGENAYGYRVPQTFNPTNISSALGTAWPMVPLLSALVLKHGAAAVAVELLVILNATFPQLVDFDNGAFMFHDTDNCVLGGVTTADSATSAYRKIYGPLSLLVGDTLASIESIRLRMELELGQSIQVRREYLNDTRVNSIFNRQGPPVYWSHTALSVGLLRLSSQFSPGTEIVSNVQNSLVCYDVLETRYLNVSTRCWSEFHNVNETRAQYNSEGLRTLLLSAWSMGIVLNTFAAVVALRFALRVLNMAKVTGLQEDWRTLLCIDIEEFGMTSFSECALMACSTAPFMFSYQLPQDSEYIANSKTSHLGSVYLDEILVTMGMTWFIRLGMDVGATLLRLRWKNGWFTQQSNLVRAVIIVGVYIVRILTIKTDRDYDNSIWSLALSCLLSAVAGVVAMLSSFVFDKATPPPHEDPISHALQLAKVPRNVHCIFSQQGTEWSYMGLVLEGWTCSPDNETLVFKSASGGLLLIVGEGGFTVQKLHSMNHCQFKALENTARSVKASIRHISIRAKGDAKPRNPETPEPPNSGTLKRQAVSVRVLLVTLVVLLQAIWAVGVPVRNILLFPLPTFNYDNSSTASQVFTGFDKSAKLKFTGPEVRAVVNEALTISLTNPEVRKVFETSGEYSIDELGQVLTPADHKTFARLYAMVFQSSEFPAGTFTPRQETIVRNNPDGTQDSYTVVCRAEDATLNGAVCVDSTGAPCTKLTSATTITNVDLGTVLGSGTVSGWQNNVAMISFVEFFYHTMRQVFAKQDWATVVAASVASRQFGSGVFTSDGQLVETSALFVLISNSTVPSSTAVSNCLASEIVLSELYIATFTLQLIQDALLKHNLYHATPVVPKNELVTARALAALDGQTLYITSAAGYYSYEETTNQLFGRTMTSTAISSTVLKRDLVLNSAEYMGSSVRHLVALASDWEGYLSSVKQTNGDKTMAVETRVLGSMFGGYLGFKDDPVHNTMGVFKLSERPATQQSDESSLAYFDQEAKIAHWYASFENEKGGNNLLRHVIAHFGTIRVEFFKNVMVAVTTDTYETSCYQALMRRVSQIVWLTALRLHPGLQYLVFMSAQNDVTDYQWFLQQMMVNSVVGENAYGGRVQFPYTTLVASSNLGSGWPVVPLLSALNQVHNASYLHQQIMTEMDATFTSLIELELGLINFRDAAHCPIGVATFGVNKDDTLQSLYAKISPGLSGLVQDVLASVSAVQADMDAALQTSVRVPLAYLQESSRGASISSAFPFVAPPTRWSHSALAVGLMRLSTKQNPFQDNVKVLADSMVCYDTLETRYLTTSVRCWSESLSSGQVRATYSSLQLRVVLFSAWAIGVILNSLGEFIALRYLVKLVRMWHLTRLDLAKWELGLLMSTHIQSLGGAISIQEAAMLAFSSLALQFGYRIPHDPGFVLSTTSLRLRYFDEFIMALGLTWTIHLGMELGSVAIRMQYRNRWFLALNTQVKAALTVVVYVLLVVTRNTTSYNAAIGSLIGIWLFALASGFGSVAVSKWFDRPPPTPAYPQSFSKDEGWRGVPTGPKSFLMACHSVLVHLSAGGTVVPLICKDITPDSYNKLVLATVCMKKRPGSIAPTMSAARQSEQDILALEDTFLK